MQIAADQLTGAHIGAHLEFITVYHCGTGVWTWAGRLHTIERHAGPDPHCPRGVVVVMLGDASSNVRVSVPGDQPITVHPHHPGN